LNVNKIGFAGTLDPLASGLMIVGTYGSPRLFPLIEHFHKTYTTAIRLDGTTESFDLEKPIIKVPVKQTIIENITLETLRYVVQKHFSGNILQSPPLYSAIWIDGKRSYERVRNGETDLKLEAKPRTIHEFKILSYTWPRIACEITVSHGTYIRSIARDIGEILGTGGYLEKLERTSL
jgi:tRNA pseudouridine55 synthase